MFSRNKTNMQNSDKSNFELDKAHNQELIRDEPQNWNCSFCTGQSNRNILNTNEHLLRPSTSFQHGVTLFEPDAAFSNGFSIQGNAPYGALPTNFYWNNNQELLLTHKDLLKPNTYNTVNPISSIVTNSCGINDGFAEQAYNYRTRSDLVPNQAEEANFSHSITPFYSNSKYILEKKSEKSISPIATSSTKSQNIQEICILNSPNWINISPKAQEVEKNLSLSKFYDYSDNIISSNDKNSKNQKFTISESNQNEINKKLTLNLLKGTADFNVTNCDIDKILKLDTQTLNNLFTDNTERRIFEAFEMSGQYPGHSRPPVGTPPPQTVWNHLTMTQGQGLNIHPTALSGASLNPAGFYTHPSMARASHLTPQLTPQLAHTQAPPTWHTPTVPAKTMTPSNTAGNPLFSLQMLVDNRQNQNQYRNAPGVQSTLDLSATSEMAENYSRIPQDIPISLTARSIDKGSRNGNIISPPIPLNGDTSCDSGISSSVPTPNSLIEPVSLSTKEIITPKITVKNFESNLKGVSNLHDKIKESSIDSFVQKVINLPPNVTIERVTSDNKKDTEVTKCKDTLSVIAQVPRNVMPVIVNLTSKDKDVIDSPNRELSLDCDRRMEDMSVRSPKTSLKRSGKKGVDSLLEKLESGNKKLGTENIGSVIVTPLEEKDTGSVKSMSPERQISRSPNRDEDVISPFSNEDSNDNTKQRRKRKLEKPVRLSKDSKTEVEDMELEPTEPTESRSCEINLPMDHTPLLINERIVNRTEQKIDEKTETPIMDNKIEESVKNVVEKVDKNLEQRVDEKLGERMDVDLDEKNEENQPVRRRRCSEGPTLSPVVNQRVRRKSSDDVTDFSKVTSPKVTGNANPFNEVESELEKMFAGIVETSEKQEPKLEDEEKSDNILKSENADNIVSTSNMQSTSLADVSSSVETKSTPKKTKKGRVRAGKRKAVKSDNVGQGGGELKDGKRGKATKGNKKQESSKKNVKKTTKVEGLREVTYDSGSNASSIRSRGPVVHVEGPRDSPLSIQVVNVPREEEEEKSKEKRKNLGNGNAGRSKRLSHQNDLDYRGKVNKAGLFSSTLSSRYDAHTTDSTWVCVFCKQGPHSVVPGDPSRPHPNLAGPHIAPGSYIVPAGVLSDLFGPYLIGKERLEDGILSADEQEIMIEQKKGGKNKRSLRHAGLADQFTAKMSKKKRNSIENSNANTVFTGMTLIPGEEQRWEVWLHEQCAVWTAGVYLAGGRVTGLQEAVWDAAKSVCEACGLTGANIGCVKRGCKAVIHYPCALTKSWLLDTSDYIPKCNIHRVT